MPKSKNRKNHKEQLTKFKTKQKQMNANAPTMPEIRNIPTWDPMATIEITGYEWEAIQNALANVQMGQQAAQSVMSRNILNGTIKMDFQKLNPGTMQYDEMTPEEKAPHVEQFEKTVASFREQQAKAAEVQAQTSTLEKPVRDIADALPVDEELNKISPAGSQLVTVEGEPLTKETTGKIITMDTTQEG